MCAKEFPEVKLRSGFKERGQDCTKSPCIRKKKLVRKKKKSDNPREATRGCCGLVQLGCCPELCREPREYYSQCWESSSHVGTVWGTVLSHQMVQVRHILRPVVALIRTSRSIFNSTEE